jgi:hypothetical protein
MRNETRSDSQQFGDLLRTLLRQGISVRFVARGRSMYPAIADGDIVEVDPTGDHPGAGGVAMVETSDGFRVHRVLGSANDFVTRGDCCFAKDEAVRPFPGTVSVLDGNHRRPVPRQRLGGILRRWIARFRGHF